MITEDYVSFETAKLLKKNGFNGLCRAFYVKSKERGIELLHSERSHNYNDYVYPRTSAPTLQMAMKWLRDIHGLFIHIDIIREASCWLADIQDIKGDVSVYPVENEFPNYEEACKAAIKYCLEKLI